MQPQDHNDQHKTPHPVAGPETEDKAPDTVAEEKARTLRERLAASLAEFQAQEFTHPADIAEYIETLHVDEQFHVLASLPLVQAAEALAEMDEHSRVAILTYMGPDMAADMVGQMSPDDAADVLDELEDEHSDELLSKIEDEDAKEIRHLMAYDPDTAGGIMNTEIVILEQDMTADQAINHLRSVIEDKEVPYYVYVVGKSDHLLGVLSLRDLLLCKPNQPLKEALNDQDLITVPFDAPREEVARVIGHYNFMALPVVDYSGRLLGVIAHDDIIDMIQDLASEDLLGMMGAGHDETVDTPWSESIRMRLPWLLVNMINSVLSASVVYFFDGSIAQMATLAVLMPMVANQAGNTGQQALAVIIRHLALDGDGVKERKAISREVKIGLCNGLILGALACAGVYFFTDNLALGVVMSVALILDMLLGALAGICIPLILRRLGRDPAQASSIFLTAITDGAGFFLFLGLATMFLL